MPGARSAAAIDPGEFLAAASHFYSVFRLAKLFEPNNATVRERLVRLDESIQAILRKAGEIRFEIRSGFLLINWTRVKFTAPTNHIFRFFLGEFTAREIGAVSFFPGLTADELGRFMVLSQQGDRIEPLLPDLNDGRLVQIVCEKANGKERLAVDLGCAGLVKHHPGPASLHQRGGREQYPETQQLLFHAAESISVTAAAPAKPKPGLGDRQGWLMSIWPETPDFGSGARR